MEPQNECRREELPIEISVEKDWSQYNGMQHQKCKRVLVKLWFNERQQDEKYLEIDLQLLEDGSINLAQLIVDFIDRQLIPLKSQVFYLDQAHKLFIFVGEDFHKPIQRSARQVLSNNCLTLLCKKTHTISDQALAYPVEQPRKRSKERTIREVISSCKEWRRLYHQGIVHQGQPEKLTLEESASKVGMSRKTLEDYFKQLRDGCRYKFDFAKHKEEKMGVLRNFVKQSAKLEESPFEAKKSDFQIEKETFHYIELCLAQQKEEPRLMYEQDIGMYLLAEEGHIVNQDSSSSDEPFLHEEEQEE